MKTKVLVTGANGQLGQCLQDLASASGFDFSFYNSSDLDISSKENIETVFNQGFDFCINCAAYTAVDKAEIEVPKARAVNHLGVKYLAECCLENNVVLIHISTDYVFDGTKNSPYKEEDVCHPISVYGKTKRAGEIAILETLTQFFIIRTSWLYSAYSKNFVKSMLKLSEIRENFNVVNDQISSPTNAMDLAKAILEVIMQNKDYGIYHFSNLGVASWYDFAKKIFRLKNIEVKLKPIPTSAYPTAAKRPASSLLDKAKFMSVFNYKIPNWQQSLAQHFNNQTLK